MYVEVLGHQRFTLLDRNLPHPFPPPSLATFATVRTLSLRVDKTHFSMKYEIKSFMEAEFARRNLFKQIAKEGAK